MHPSAVIRNHVSKQVKIRTQATVRQPTIHAKFDHCTSESDERQRHPFRGKWKPNLILVQSKPTTLQYIHRDTSINHTDETGLRTTRICATTARKRRQRSARRAGRSKIRNSSTRTEATAPARSPDLRRKNNCIIECKVEGRHRESERYNARRS